MAGVYENFSDIFLRCEILILGIVEKKDDLVGLFKSIIKPDELGHKFMGISPDSGESGAVHSAIDSYAHGTIIQAVHRFAPEIWLLGD